MIGLSEPALRAASTMLFSLADHSSLHPDGNARPRHLRRRLVSADKQLARFLRRTLDDFLGANESIDVGVQEVVPPDLHVCGISGQFRLSILELSVPLAPFPGLKSEFVLYRHQHAKVTRPTECRLHVVAELPVVAAQVVHQKIGEVLFGGSHSDIGTRLSRQFADQENEAADSTRKRVAGLPIRGQRNDLFVELAKEDARY